MNDATNDATNIPSTTDQLDGEVLGESVGDDGLPGIGDYPADQALGVNDPNLVADDDFAMREARTRSEEMPADDRYAVGDLVPPVGDDDVRDDVQQEIAGVGTPDREDPAAEVDAMDVISDEQTG